MLALAGTFCGVGGGASRYPDTRCLSWTSANGDQPSTYLLLFSAVIGQLFTLCKLQGTFRWRIIKWLHREQGGL